MHEKPERLATVLGCCVLVAGCSSALLPASQRVLNAEEVICKELEAHGVIRFRSYNGEWKGTDGDIDIELGRNRMARLIGYGQAGVEEISGTYSVDDNGEITLDLPTRKSPFVSMLLYRDEKSLLLLTADGSGLPPDWPFRRIPNDKPLP